MVPELEQKLVNKYPAIFRDLLNDNPHSAMVWGIAVGNGWYSIIDVLCLTITNTVDGTNRLYPSLKFSVVAAQVKEKWGSLRFYVDFHFAENLSESEMKIIDKAIQSVGGAIALAEKMSDITCSLCGSMTGYNEGFASSQVICDSCRKNLNDYLTKLEKGV